MKKQFLLFLLLVLSGLPAWAQAVDVEREFPARSILTWKAGMRFVMPAEVTGFDGCPLMALKGPVFKGTDLYGASPDDQALAGTTLTFQRLDVFQDRGYDNKSGSGAEKVAVVFKAANGKQYAHILDKPLAELKKEAPTVGAPCLVSLDDVEKARKLLVGRTVYVRQQYIAAGSTRDDVRYLPKYVPVKITQVKPGKGRRPIRLAFEYVGSGQKQEQEYGLGGTNDVRTYHNGEPLQDNFLTCFSFTDPRASAGVTKDALWKAIQQGALMKGMSMKEVELAMGKPKRRSESVEEDRRTVWYYSRFQGKQWELLFTNGILDQYVNYQN